MEKRGSVIKQTLSVISNQLKKEVSCNVNVKGLVQLIKH